MHTALMTAGLWLHTFPVGGVNNLVKVKNVIATFNKFTTQLQTFLAYKIEDEDEIH